MAKPSEVDAALEQTRPRVGVVSHFERVIVAATPELAAELEALLANTAVTAAHVALVFDRIAKTSPNITDERVRGLRTTPDSVTKWRRRHGLVA